MKTKALLATACTLLVTGAAWAQNGPIRFDGLDHTPIGGAVLTLATDGSFLEVGELAPHGDAGVRTHFATATRWEATFDKSEPMLPGSTVTFSAHSDGVIASSARLEMMAGSLVIATDFTGADIDNGYFIEVWNQGQPQITIPGLFAGSIMRLDPAGDGTGGPSSGDGGGGDGGGGDDDHWPDEKPEGELPEFPDLPDTTFDQLQSGACLWIFETAANFRISVDALAFPGVIGDEIRIIENAPGPGGYPYVDFQEMQIRASLPSFQITSELIHQQ